MNTPTMAFRLNLIERARLKEDANKKGISLSENIRLILHDYIQKEIINKDKNEKI